MSYILFLMKSLSHKGAAFQLAQLKARHGQKKTIRQIEKYQKCECKNEEKTKGSQQKSHEV